MLHRDDPGYDPLDLQIEIQRLQKSNAHWSRSWKAVVEDPWFQKQLARRAQRLLRGSAHSLQRQEDLAQDVCLLFARHLKRRGELGFDPDKGSFRAFLCAMTRHFCLQVLQQPSFKQPAGCPLETEHLIDDRWRHAQFVAELKELAAGLADPVRTTVAGFLRGSTVQEIAGHSNCTSRTIYRHLHQAVSLLRKELDLDEISLTRKIRNQKNKSKKPFEDVNKMTVR